VGQCRAWRKIWYTDSTLRESILELIMDIGQAERIIERNATRNFVLNVLDGGMFFLGLSMVSRYTVLPLVVERLGGERWMQGLIPMLAGTGWFLPGLFIAPLIASRPHRKPFLLVATLFERLPFLLFGLVLLLAPQAPPTWLLVSFFLLYAVHSFAAGIGAIPWQDFIARVIPGNRWGIFFGVQSGLGGLLGVGGAAISAIILASQVFPPGPWPAGWPVIPPLSFPQNIGALAVLCFIAMVISYFFLAATVEPPQQPAPRQGIGEFMLGVFPLLRRDARFRTYLLSRMAIALGLLGHNFLTAAALERFGLRNEAIAAFTASLLGAQAVADLGLGWLADRWGHKQILVLSTGLGLLALLLAIVAPSPIWYTPIFLLVGAAQAGYMLSGFTLVFSFSTPVERPTYLGVANTALAPVSVAGPLLAGWLAEVAGYEVLFVVLLLIGVGGMALLHWRVPAPDRQVAPTGAGE
jgi:MFS family permease